ncbi:hypothetical protein BU17DRAFT_61977 [Hysterangium stoloniferum]|nr:hypothetical protein BU17DRAFT_61977 [Hysterangium stoloniferum]
MKDPIPPLYGLQSRKEEPPILWGGEGLGREKKQTKRRQRERHKANKSKINKGTKNAPETALYPLGSVFPDLEHKKSTKRGSHTPLSPLISMNFSTSTNFDFAPFPGIPEDFDQLEIHPDIIDNGNINADTDNCAEQVFSESYGGACNSNGFIAPAGSAGTAEFYQAQSRITSQPVRAYTENPGPLLPMRQYLQENGVNNRRDNQAPTFPVLPGLENSPPINPTGSASQPQKNSGHALVSSLRARRDIQPRQQRVPTARPAPYTIPLVHRAHSLDVSALPTLTNRPHYLKVPARTSTKHTQPPHLQAHAAPSITNTQTHIHTSPSPTSTSLVTDREDFQKESKTLQWDGRTFASGDREAKAVIGSQQYITKAASDAWFTGQLNIKREVVIPLDSNIISYLCRNARSHRNTLAKGVRDDIIGTFNLHEHKELNVRLNVIQTLSSNAVFIYEKDGRSYHLKVLSGICQNPISHSDSDTTSIGTSGSTSALKAPLGLIFFLFSSLHIILAF